jgi:hypothetical protein
MAKGKRTKEQTTIYKHTHKANDRVTRTTLKKRDELTCQGRVSISCSTSDTHRVDLVTNPMITQRWGKDRKVFTTSGTYPWARPQTFEVRTST